MRRETKLFPIRQFLEKLKVLRNIVPCYSKFDSKLWIIDEAAEIACPRMADEPRVECHRFVHFLAVFPVACTFSPRKINGRPYNLRLH